MAKINMLNGWSGNSEFFGKRSAQGYLNSGKASFSVGSACGAGDGEDKPNPDPKPSACGSACGAGDK